MEARAKRAARCHEAAPARKEAARFGPRRHPFTIPERKKCKIYASRRAARWRHRRGKRRRRGGGWRRRIRRRVRGRSGGNVAEICRQRERAARGDAAEEKTVLFVTLFEQRKGPSVCSAENMPYGRYVEVPAKGERSERRRVRTQCLRAGAEPSRLLPFVTCPRARSRSRL